MNALKTILDRIRRYVMRRFAYCVINSDVCMCGAGV